MSIGQTGRRSQQFGQHHLRRHQVSYTPSMEVPDLTPPPEEPAPELPPLEEMEAEIQRAIGSISATEEKNTDMVEAEGTEISPEAVAERVYAMLLADTKRQRERLGNRYNRT